MYRVYLGCGLPAMATPRGVTRAGFDSPALTAAFAAFGYGQERIAVKISITKRPGSPYTLLIDASTLHRELRELGVPLDGDRFADQPYSYNNRSIDADGRLTAAALLRVMPAPVEINLGHHFGRPPTPEQIRKLVDEEHIRALVTNILAHYQPIDVQVNVVLRRPDAGGVVQTVVDDGSRLASMAGA